MDKILEKIEKILNLILAELNENKYIDGGHNGPYYDQDTPVRNTAHWLIVLSHYYRITGETKYLNAIRICADYLTSSEATPMNSIFFCRYNTKKDFANGTIGPAWAIEGLVKAYEVLGDERYISKAKEVFLTLPFDQNKKIWTSLNVDGSIRGFDMTFNHQLWFATSGVLICKASYNEKINRITESFFDNIDAYLNIYRNGLVKHSIVFKKGLVRKAYNVLKKIRNIKYLIQGKSMKYKENGYHTFNIFAFALIKKAGYKPDIFKSVKFKKAVRYCFSDKLHKSLDSNDIRSDLNSMSNVKNTKINIYGYSYNSPAYELPLIYSQFKEYLRPGNDYEVMIEEVISKHIEYTYDLKKKSFSKNNEDEKTLNARVYEYIRCLEE